MAGCVCFDHPDLCCCSGAENIKYHDEATVLFTMSRNYCKLAYVP